MRRSKRSIGNGWMMTAKLSTSERTQRSIFQFDLIIFLAMLALMTIGILFIYSSNVTSAASAAKSREFIFQIVWIVGGLIIYFLLQTREYDYFDRISHYIYGLVILLLIITLLWGEVVNGA